MDEHDKIQWFNKEKKMMKLEISREDEKKE